jgi:hypothetical protein
LVLHDRCAPPHLTLAPAGAAEVDERFEPRTDLRLEQFVAARCE